MRRRKLFWQLLNSYLWVNITFLVLIALAIAFAFKGLFLEKYREDLKSKANLLSNIFVERIINKNYSSIDSEVELLGSASSTRITIILPDGKVIADSKANVKYLDNHINRPEIRDSIKNGYGSSSRFSNTLKKNLMYVAKSVNINGEFLFVMRTSVATDKVNERIAGVYRKIAVVFAFIIIINALVSLWLSRRFGIPLTSMVNKFQKIANYDFTGKIALKKSDSEEMDAVACAINNISEKLQENQDEIKKLENMRKEFVANVSHELKTPITSIKGFVETLLDGALNDEKEARNFLEIVLRQSNRLDLIINDLLSLSKFENDSISEEVVLAANPVILAIESAVDTCKAKAAKQGLDINVKCDEKIEAMIDIHLMEQALINLINNAIKYSGTTDPILVSADRKGDQVVISVKDNGVGIPSKHQHRIFERFYRVDKARSREQGGTGLGLSIVKHIAAMHNGEVVLASKLGEGSEFKIILG